MSSETRRHHTGLALIAGFKALKAILLIAAGIGAFRLLNPVLAERSRCVARRRCRQATGSYRSSTPPLHWCVDLFRLPAPAAERPRS